MDSVKGCGKFEEYEDHGEALGFGHKEIISDFVEGSFSGMCRIEARL